MKIAYLSAAPLSSRRASAVHVMKMCAAFARAGHEVVLAGRRAGAETDEEIFQAYGLEPTFRLSLAAPGISWMDRRRIEVSVVGHAVAEKPDLFYARNRAGAATVAFGQKPLIFEAHELPERLPPRLLEKLIIAGPALRRLVTISEVLKKDYLARHPGLGARLLVAHDGADIPEAPLRQTRRDRPVIGYVGSLYPGKGMEMILCMAARRPDWRFEVVGGSAEEIERWRAKDGGSNVFFTGHLPHSRVPERLAGFDVALVPLGRKVAVDYAGSDIGRWTSPMKLFEYMAHGVPVVATDQPSIREVVTPGQTGYLAPVGDVDAWLGAAEKVLGDPIEAAAVAQRAQALLRDKFSWDVRARRVLRGVTW